MYLVCNIGPGNCNRSKDKNFDILICMIIFFGLIYSAFPWIGSIFFTFIFTGIPQNYVPRETCFLLESITTDAPSRRGVSCNIPEDCLDAWPLLLMKAGTRWITDSRADPSVWVHFWSTDMVYLGFFNSPKIISLTPKLTWRTAFLRYTLLTGPTVSTFKNLMRRKGSSLVFPSAPPQLYFTLQPIVSPPTVTPGEHPSPKLLCSYFWVQVHNLQSLQSNCIFPLPEVASPIFQVLITLSHSISFLSYFFCSSHWVYR